MRGLGRKKGRLAAATTFAAALIVGLTFGVQVASAVDFHGIAFLKGCDTPVNVGDPYQCAYQILNVVDSAHDTLTITSISDVVHSAGGPVASGNLLDLTGSTLTLSGGASCDGTKCTLPFGSSISTPFLSHYTVQPADFNLPNHALTDTATLIWQDTCSSHSPNCPRGNQAASTGSQATVHKLVSNTSTAIHNAAHQTVTVVEAGSTVHDFVTVAGQPGKPVPTGNVNIDWFTNGSCSGGPAASSGSIGPLDANGQFDATGFPQGPLAPGHYAFEAHYLGDNTYAPSDGACEPLTVVDANIQITPNGTNRVGQTHTFTAHVNVNDGNGFANAPDGTQISFTIDSGPGSLGAPNPCTTSGGTGSCQITLSSNTTGVTTVSAHTTVSVGGLSLTRNTDGTGANSGPAVKTWVDAKISIAPSATNEVNHPHTFTVTLQKDTGNGAGFQPAAGEHVDVTLTDSNGASHTAPTGSCTNAGPNTDAAGQCTITFTSPTAGKVTGHATSTLSVNGSAPFTVQTDGTGQNSGDAVKTFVDANISIAPNGVNRVGDSHTFTAHVQVNDGSGGGFVDAPAGTQISFSIDSGPGSFTTPNPCTVVSGGSCQITLTSATTGVTTVSAHTTLSVGGVSLTRDTNGSGGNSGPATKTWVNARIHITPSATNRVGASHTFTVTLEKDTGNGAGFQPAAGEHVDVTLTDANGASHTAPTGSCTNAGANTDANGQCTITFTSNSTGTVTGHASSTLSVAGSAPFTVQTDGVAPNGPDAVKTYVDAKISIAPNATNEVNHPHTFTVTLQKDTGDGAGFHAAAGEHVDVTLTDSNGASHTAPTGSCTNAGPNTDAAGQCTITFTSPTAGKVTGHATSTLSVNGSAPFTVQTDGTGQNSGDAVKTFVDANIQITPQTATNKVGSNHVLTGHVNINDGSGGGFTSAPDGTVILFSLTNSGGATATFVGPSSCTTGGGTGSCQVTISSPTAGQTTIHASTTLSVGGVSLTRATGDGLAGDSPDAIKNWANARISIAPSATNEVGHPHTFTVTLEKDTGGGFVPAAGEHVDVTLTDSNGASHSAPTGSCTNAGPNTDANGQCTITFNSNSAGQVTGHASSTLTINGLSFTVQTDGTGDNSGDAVKTYVDANIQITPNGVNRVGQSHTFTAHVNVNAGDGNGFVPAPDGTQISFTIDSGPGSFTTPNPCTTAGGTGSCQITLTSSTTGVTTVSAHTTVSVAGLSVHRDTNGTGANSGPATKTWVNAAISIAPSATNEVGHPHTFTVTLTKDTGTGTFVPAAGEHVDVTLTDGGGASHTAPTGSCTNAGANTDANGQCTITFNSNTAGTVTGHASSTLSVGGSAPFTVQTDGVAPNSADAVKTYVDANIQITPNGVNRVGSPHTFTAHVNVNNGSGFVPAPDGTQISFTIDSGPGSFTTVNPCTTAGGTGSCQITLTSSTTGVTTVSAHTTVSVGGISLTRNTDGTGANSGPATKTWVNAAISIAPNATNEVGHSHTFTVTLVKDTGNGAGFQPAAGEHVDVTLTDSNGASHTAPTGSCTNAGANTDANGQCTITFTSNTAGKVTGHATSTLSVGGSAPFTVATDGNAPNSGDAVKTFVDANISITPNGVNRVGQTHTFTAHVQVNDGSGAGFVDAPAGTSISFTIDSGPGSFTTANPCTVASGGSCQITLTSSVTGVTTVSAHTAVIVGGVQVNRDTNGTHGSSGPATKRWVDAYITIAPNATNEVGHNHTFTTTVFQDIGDGTGFHPAASKSVTVTLTNSNGAVATPAGPFNGTTDANGQFQVTFTSNTAGKVTGHATSTLSVNGSAPFTVATDGTGQNSGDAVKTFVDANIQITPQTATNPVGTNHTLTGHVNVNDGSGGGFVNAPAGTVISFSLTNSGGASATFVGPSSCTTVGTTGSCTVVISSPTAGTTTINASTTLSVGGVTLTRATGDTHTGDSPDASKKWADDTVTTKVRDAAGNDITGQTVPGGTVVHDEATVTKTANTPASVPNPTGTVSFTLYGTNSCSGTVVATDPNKALNGSGVATSANFTTPTAGGSFSYKAHYNGDANYPAHDGPCEPFTVQPPVTAQIAPTQVSCQDFAGGGAPTLTQITYPSSNGKIGQGINPGVFFYYAKITTTTANQVVTVTQSNTSTNNAALFKPSQVRLYTGNCSSWTAGTATASGASFTVSTPGSYIISIKYDAKSIAGTNVPVPATITYNFISSLGPSTAASVVLAPQ